GSTLPFRIRPSAPTSSVHVEVDGDVGLGTSSPDHRLHVAKNEANPGVALVELDNTNEAGAELIRATNDDCLDAADNCWVFGRAASGNFIISRVGSGVNEVQVNASGTMAFSGDVTIQGDFISGGVTLNVPDYVFEPDYELMPLHELEAFIQENRHLPKVPSAKDVAEQGLNMSQLQMRLLEKVEELTLYTLDQQKRIAEMQQRIEELEGGTAEH
ncbi:MAG: hypothetical protein MI919_00780, partial [Holophagales bacterium]|nr:hypothetical protein [Holophagales bacterium]